MHKYDRDGETAQYRRRKVRSDNIAALMFAIGCICAALFAAIVYVLWHADGWR